MITLLPQYNISIHTHTHTHKEREIDKFDIIPLSQTQIGWNRSIHNGQTSTYVPAIQIKK